LKQSMPSLPAKTLTVMTKKKYQMHLRSYPTTTDPHLSKTLSLVSVVRDPTSLIMDYLSLWISASSEAAETKNQAQWASLAREVLALALALVKLLMDLVRVLVAMPDMEIRQKLKHQRHLEIQWPHRHLEMQWLHRHLEMLTAF